MAEQTPNTPVEQTDSQEPFIPPQLLLILAGVGLLVALIIAATQPTFNVFGYGALAFAALSLVLWALLAPGQLTAILTGRVLRFGGTSIIVTLIVIAAMIAIYTLVRGQQWRVDLTQRNEYSLTDQSRAAMQTFGADPNAPSIKLVAFYTAAQSGRRDQDTVLFDDYKAASNGKITYEFVNPDQAPQVAELYGVTRNGQIAVVTLGADGTPDVANKELVASPTQENLTNAILKVAAQGDFIAYFLTVQDGESDQMSVLRQSLTNRYDWTVQDITLAQLASPEGEFKLNDPNRDGEVVVIPGGSRPLGASELQVLQDYLTAGGSVIIFAASPLNTDGVSLATAEDLNTWLAENFGLRFNSDVIVDQRQAFQSPLIPVITDLDPSSFITTNGLTRAQKAMVFETPMTITVGSAPNVTTTSLARTSASAYTKSGADALAALLQGGDQAALQAAFAQAEADPVGPFTVAASAQNTTTGAKLILFSSTSVATDTFSGLNVDNLSVGFNSLIWATDFNSFFQAITVQQEQRPQDTPLFADAQQVRNINFITIILLPFGTLALGLFVWWNNRERARR